MEKIVATVKNVQVMKDRNGKSLFSVRITLNKEIEGIVAKRDDQGLIIPDEFEKTMVNYVSVNQFDLASQIISNDADIAMFAAIVGERFDQAQFGATMQGSEITIERELVENGQTYTDYDGQDKIAERDKFLIKSVSVKPSAMNKMLMEKTMMMKLSNNA